MYRSLTSVELSVRPWAISARTKYTRINEKQKERQKEKKKKKKKEIIVIMRKKNQQQHKPK